MRKLKELTMDEVLDAARWGGGQSAAAIWGELRNKHPDISFKKIRDRMPEFVVRGVVRMVGMDSGSKLYASALADMTPAEAIASILGPRTVSQITSAGETVAEFSRRANVSYSDSCKALKAMRNIGLARLIGKRHDGTFAYEVVRAQFSKTSEDVDKPRHSVKGAA